MTGSSVSLVEVGRAGNVEVTHEVFQICARRFDDKMKVVDHEDEGDQTDLVDLYRTGEKFKKFLSVGIGQENFLSSVAPASDIVTCVFILDAQSAAHAWMIAGARVKIKDKDLTPLAH
jgi:hypothetical protein